tara:strand:- start:19 stop:387 length:369 start_codon:yes stop_codon:yes gene_type:complete
MKTFSDIREDHIPAMLAEKNWSEQWNEATVIKTINSMKKMKVKTMNEIIARNPGRAVIKTTVLSAKYTGDVSLLEKGAIGVVFRAEIDSEGDKNNPAYKETMNLTISYNFDERSHSYQLVGM